MFANSGNTNREWIIHKFASALRELTPCGQSLSDSDICSLWFPTGIVLQLVNDYGDTFCTCGHPIKYQFVIACKENNQIYNKVGSVCIYSIFGRERTWVDAIALESDLRKMYHTLIDVLRGRHIIDEAVITARNGFSQKARAYMRYNSNLDESALEYIDELAQRRTVRNQSERQRRYLRYVASYIIRWLNGLNMTTHTF